MRALLLTLLAVAWLEDGLLRRVVDARLLRHPATSLPWFLLAGTAIGGAALVGTRLGLLPWALALAMTGFALAPRRDDASPPSPAQARLLRLREAAPAAAGGVAACAVALAAGEVTSRHLAVIGATATLLLAARALFAPLQARLAASRLPAPWLAVPAPLLVALTLALSVAGLLPP